MGMGSHQCARMKTDEWLTPPEIIKALGPFDLDPCSSMNRPWNTAAKHYMIDTNGLIQSWAGRVWLNPPYGIVAGRWLAKLVDHGNGIALIFARTETKMFFKYVWNKADAILFIRGRLFFYRNDGIRAKTNSGAPSVLIAYGTENAQILKRSGIDGMFVCLKGRY